MTDTSIMTFSDGYEYRPTRHCDEKRWILFHNGIQKGAIEECVDGCHDGTQFVKTYYYYAIICQPEDEHAECHHRRCRYSCKTLRRGQTNDFQKCQQFLVDEVSGRNKEYRADVYGWPSLADEIYLFKNAKIKTTVNGKFCMPSCIGLREGSGFVFTFDEAVMKLKESKALRVTELRQQVTKIQEEIASLERDIDPSAITIKECEAEDNCGFFYD